MDIALTSMSLSQGKVQQQASLSVMKIAMGNAEQQGEAVKELISTSNVKALQQAAQPHLGGNIDWKL
ncbi:YjfB family protein [Priestia megaterium]